MSQLKEDCCRDTKRHAFLILAHNEPELLAELVHSLDDGRNDIFVHIDKKVDDGLFKNEIKKKPVKEAGLIFIEDKQRLKIYWGHPSIVQAEIVLLKKAVEYSDEKKFRYQYYHILSGTDRVLKSQNYLHNFFALYPNLDFIGHYCPRNVWSNEIRASEYRHYMLDRESEEKKYIQSYHQSSSFFRYGHNLQNPDFKHRLYKFASLLFSSRSVDSKNVRTYRNSKYGDSRIIRLDGDIPVTYYNVGVRKCTQWMSCTDGFVRKFLKKSYRLVRKRKLTPIGLIKVWLKRPISESIRKRYAAQYMDEYYIQTAAYYTHFDVNRKFDRQGYFTPDTVVENIKDKWSSIKKNIDGYVSNTDGQFLDRYREKEIVGDMVDTIQSLIDDIGTRIAPGTQFNLIELVQKVLDDFQWTDKANDVIAFIRLTMNDVDAVANGYADDLNTLEAMMMKRLEDFVRFQSGNINISRDGDRFKNIVTNVKGLFDDDGEKDKYVRCIISDISVLIKGLYDINEANDQQDVIVKQRALDIIRIDLSFVSSYLYQYKLKQNDIKQDLFETVKICILHFEDLRKQMGNLLDDKKSNVWQKERYLDRKIDTLNEFCLMKEHLRILGELAQYNVRVHIRDIQCRLDNMKKAFALEICREDKSFVESIIDREDITQYVHNKFREERTFVGRVRRWWQIRSKTIRDNILLSDELEIIRSQMNIIKSSRRLMTLIEDVYKLISDIEYSIENKKSVSIESVQSIEESLALIDDKSLAVTVGLSEWYGSMRAIKWENAGIKNWTRDEYKYLCADTPFIFGRKFDVE